MRHEKIWIIEPDYNRAPAAGYYAMKPSKSMPESAIKISQDHAHRTSDNDRWRLYVNGKLILSCKDWKELAMKYPQGMPGRVLTADEYDRLVQQRINDERNGGIVSVDPMTHPAPRF